jgi:copper chaperone NosL
VSLRRVHRHVGRIILGLAALLMLSSLLFPLWRARMEAPQYKGDEALLVRVYATRVEGDLREIRLLNTYAGVVLPEEFEELAFVPWILGGLAALGLGAAAGPKRLRFWLAAVLLAGLLTVTVGGGLVLQQRLYQLGHDREKSPFARFKDFTPPMFGSAKVANFTVTAGLGAGGWCFVGAFLLVGAGTFFEWKQRGRE